MRRLQIKTPIRGQTTTVLRKKGFTDMADSYMAINRSLKQKSSYCYRNTRQCFHYIFCFTFHLITHICRSMLPYYYYSFIGFLCGCCCFNLILNLFNFSGLLHLTLCLISPPVCTCTYTVVLVFLSIMIKATRGCRNV